MGHGVVHFYNMWQQFDFNHLKGVTRECIINSGVSLFLRVLMSRGLVERREGAGGA